MDARFEAELKEAMEADDDDDAFALPQPAEEEYWDEGAVMPAGGDDRTAPAAGPLTSATGAAIPPSRRPDDEGHDVERDLEAELQRPRGGDYELPPAGMHDEGPSTACMHGARCSTTRF